MALFEKMQIREASIQDLQETAKLFDEYRLFYKQKSDLAGARKFIEEKIRKQESRIYLLMEG
ncbi:toxin-antitoxin system, toxin component, GNAT domain protein [Leptospira sp. P2653]|nr:toxin-antitoxin system, toxin component, GNAT domain protein [Leptospira sp. P2653]